ncbi:hypothetical protein D3C76_135120 [compost metagenome]
MKKMKINSIKLDPTDNVWEQIDLDWHVVSTKDGEKELVRPQLHICSNKDSRMIVDSKVTFQNN